MRINRLLKRELRAKNLRYDGPLRPADEMAKHRPVPVKRLISKLDLIPVSGSAADGGGAGGGLRHPAPAPAYRHQRRALRRAGERVTRGQLLADIPADALGAPVHASIDGPSPPSRSRPLRL